MTSNLGLDQKYYNFPDLSPLNCSSNDAAFTSEESNKQASIGIKPQWKPQAITVADSIPEQPGDDSPGIKQPTLPKHNVEDLDKFLGVDDVEEEEKKVEKGPLIRIISLGSDDADLNLNVKKNVQFMLEDLEITPTKDEKELQSFGDAL